MRELGIVKDAAVLCAEGKVLVVGTRGEVERHPRSKDAAVHDCGGRVVLPGFVDSHTHPVFMQPRLVDFEKRIAGATYEQIAAAGGGIRSSVANVRAANAEQLANAVAASLTRMSSEGTTTVECKSGYGLSVESELASLRAIKAAAAKWRGTVKSTFLGAHVVSAEYRGKEDDYVAVVCEQMIPQVAREKLAEYVDVFCERGAFTPEQTEKVFAAARAHGLGTRAHVCQFTPAELGRFAPYQPASLDHLDCVSGQEARALAHQPTIGTLLPGAAYFLGHEHYPPARMLIDSGVAVALATDFNPGTSPTTNIQFVLSLACTQMHMTPEEAITAATINGACALGLQDRKGSIEVGKDADLAIFDAEDYRELPYWFGSNRCSATVIAGALNT